MGKHGRPANGLDEYLDWQERLKSYQASGLTVEEFCQQEGVSRSTYDRWARQLKDGIPETIASQGSARQDANVTELKFLPVSLTATPVEIELPNGSLVRLPVGVGQAAILAAIEAAGALRAGVRKS